MPSKKVAVVGTGVIGAGWVTHFLARGLDVIASDPAPGAEERLRTLVNEQMPIAVALGAVEGAGIENLRFEADVQKAVETADFVQENGPERVEFKRELFSLMDAAAPHGTILASSSSGIPSSEFQGSCMHPERVLIGHPFNPPHVIPLVEVVGGKLTSAAAIQQALSFYESVGKRPIHVKQEIKGHVTNRLQAALWREAYGLVQAGIASVEDVDLAISNGPGLRWAILGPFVNQQLSGGAGGMQHLLDHLGPPMDDWWQDLYQTRLTEDLKAKIVAGSLAETASWNMNEVANERDKLLVSLILGKLKYDNIP